ncbi:MAG: MFS transporter [Ancrocorticia sp.]|uniref:MFS transporter n=1 Tax=Ancrocorticia sp. TaxID=2593684 RepID=UPI003F8E1A0C
MNKDASNWGNAHRRLCILTVLLATAASSLMQTFLTVSLPTLTKELDALGWYGWVTGIYLATSTLFIPVWAVLSDRIGPRTVFMAGMALWATATWAASAAGSITWLLGARALQGMASAAIVPAGFAAIIAVYPGRYGRLIGLMGAVQATVTLAGGPLGGWLGTSLGWRGSLLIVAAVAVFPILLGWLTLPRGAQSASATGPVRLWRSPQVRRAVSQTMLLAVIAFGVSSYLPLLLQTKFHPNVAHSAVFVTPTLIGVAIGSGIGGVLAERRDTTRIAWFIALMGLTLVWAPFVVAASIGSALAAAGVGVGLPSQLIAVERIATTAHASKVGGIIQAARNTGGALGVAILGIPLQLGVTSELGACYAFAAMLGLCCLTLIIGYITEMALRSDL